MKRISSIVCIMFSATYVVRAQQLPEWSVSARPGLHIGDDVELHRVTDASTLADGGVAIADAGNQRILIVDARGHLSRAIGRDGEGPGEFRSISYVQAFGDTLVAYDALLKRASVWRTDGTLLNTISLGGGALTVDAALSPHSLLLVERDAPHARGTGLYRDSVNLLILDTRTSRSTRLGRYEWQFQYFYGQENGFSSYSTPFLSATHVLGQGSSLIVLPMHSARVDITNVLTRRHAMVSLPLARRAFQRGIVAHYRDSLVALAGANTPSGERIRNVFGDRFPAPPYAPRVAGAVLVGNNVWVRVTPTAGERVSHWLIVDPRTSRLIARATTPITMKVLGGSADRLIVMERDALDVEYVNVYAVKR